MRIIFINPGEVRNLGGSHQKEKKECELFTTIQLLCEKCNLKTAVATKLFNCIDEASFIFLLHI